MVGCGRVGGGGGGGRERGVWYRGRSPSIVAGRVHLFRVLQGNLRRRFLMCPWGYTMKKIAIAVAPFYGFHDRFGCRSGGAALHQGAGAVRCRLNWGGFYVGGHVGGAWTNEQWINTANTSCSATLPGEGFRQRGTGIFGGGHGLQLAGQQLCVRSRGHHLGPRQPRHRAQHRLRCRPDDQFSWRADWMATITGRAGFAVNNNLFYVKGGYAGVNNRLSVSMWCRRRVGLADPVAQWLDRRRRLGIRHYPELDRRT